MIASIRRRCHDTVSRTQAFSHKIYNFGDKLLARDKKSLPCAKGGGSQRLTEGL